MARNPFSLDLALDGGGQSGGTTIAAIRTAQTATTSSASPREILGAAETQAFSADLAVSSLVETSVEFDFAAADTQDSFSFRSDFALPDAVEADIPLALLRAIIEFLRNRNTDTYTSGEGENGVISDFNIEVVFKGQGWTDDFKDTFIKASEYLSTIITGDLVDDGNIDDVRIEAEITDIDGVGGVLGQAGPTDTRGPFQGWLTTEGIMEFDSADAGDYLADGLFDDIVLHEMMHVLGVGTLWDVLGLTSGSVASGTMTFTGENAILAYEAEFGGTGEIAVETDGGPGTAGGHWDEDVFGDEIMTGFINDTPVYVSSMTVASFEDMGYETIWDASDPGAAMPQLDDILIA